jgi:hypothetical protein
MHSFALSVWRKLRSLTGDLVFRNAFPGAGSSYPSFSLAVHAQQGEIKAVVVQPGAPGQPTQSFAVIYASETAAAIRQGR